MPIFVISQYPRHGLRALHIYSSEHDQMYLLLRSQNSALKEWFAEPSRWLFVERFFEMVARQYSQKLLLSNQSRPRVPA